MKIHQLENKLNNFVLPQVALLQEQFTTINDSILKLSVQLQQSDQREQNIMSLIHDHYYPTQTTSTQSSIVQLEANISREELEQSIVNSLADKKNFQAHLSDDLRTTQQMNQLQKQSLNNLQQMHQDYQLQSSRIQNIQAEILDISTFINSSKRMFNLDEIIKKNFDEKVVFLIEQNNTQKERLFYLEQNLQKYNQSIKDKIGFSDISSLNDSFHQDFTHKSIFDEAIQKLNSLIELTQQDKVERHELSSLQQQVASLQNEIHSKIVINLEEKMSSYISQTLQKYALKDSVEYQKVLNDMQQSKNAQDIKTTEKTIMSYVMDWTFNNIKQSKEMFRQIQDSMDSQKEDNLKFFENQRVLESNAITQDNIERDKILFQEIFQQLLQKFPDHSEELKILKNQLDEILLKYSYQDNKVDHVQEISLLNHQSNSKSIMDKLSQNVFDSFKKEVETNYLKSTKGSEVLYRVISLEAQQKTSFLNQSEMSSQLINLTEKHRILNYQFQGQNFEELKKNSCDQGDQMVIIERNLEQKLGKNEFIQTSDKQYAHFQKLITNVLQISELVKSNLIRHIENLTYHFMAIFNIKTSNIPVRLEEHEKQQRFLVKQLETIILNLKGQDPQLQPKMRPSSQGCNTRGRQSSNGKTEEVNFQAQNSEEKYIKNTCEIINREELSKINQFVDVQTSFRESKNQPTQINFNKLTQDFANNTIRQTPRSGRAQSHQRCKRINLFKDENSDRQSFLQDSIFLKQNGPLLRSLEKINKKSIDTKTRNPKSFL